MELEDFQNDFEEASTAGGDAFLNISKRKAALADSEEKWKATVESRLVELFLAINALQGDSATVEATVERQCEDAGDGSIVLLDGAPCWKKDSLWHYVENFQSYTENGNVGIWQARVRSDSEMCYHNIEFLKMVPK